MKPLRSLLIVAGILGIVAVLATLPAYQDPAGVGHDWIFHFPNACQYALSLQSGVVVAHLTPDFFAGLGGVNFKYYPPYSYLPVSGLIASGVPVKHAFAVALTLSFFVAGLGMYCWTRLHFSRLAGIIGGCLYQVAPYHIHDYHRRFAYPELWGIALAPWVFWCADLAARSKRAWASPVLSVLLALTGIVHNLTCLMILLVLPVFWVCRSGFGVGSLKRLFLILAGALLLGAFYLFPAYLDLDEVLLSRKFTDVAWYVRAGIKLPWLFQAAGGGGMFTSPTPGLWFLLLGAWGSILLIRQNRPSRGPINGSGPGIARFCIPVLAVLCLLLATRTGSHLAYLVTPLRYLQFPWRFLLLANVFLTFAAAAAVEQAFVRPSGARWKKAVSIAAVVGLLGGTVIFGLRLGPLDRKPVPTLRDYGNVMARYPWFGDAENMYSPLRAEDARETAHRTDRRKTIWTVSGRGEPRLLENGIETIRFRVDNPGGAWTVVLRRNYFDGWQAEGPSAGIKVEPDPATGLIRVSGRRGGRAISLHYVGSKAFRIGVWVSIGGVVLLAAALLRSFRR